MNNITIYSRSDIITDRIAGEDRELEFSYIIAEFDNGARFQLRDSEISYAYENQYGFYQRRDPEEVQKQQDKRIAKINAHLAAGGSLNKEHWFEISPRYGSEAYLTRPSLAEMLEKAL